MSQSHGQVTPTDIQRYDKFVHSVALVCLVACPAIALLPPRKLDFYTLGLIGTTAYSGNYLIRERTGRSIWQTLSGRERSGAIVPPTEQANLNREIQAARQEMLRQGKVVATVSEEVNARDAWKVRREQEIKEDLEEGKGLSDMIVDQIWEVWNWGKPKEEDDE